MQFLTVHTLVYYNTLKNKISEQGTFVHQWFIFLSSEVTIHDAKMQGSV